MPKIKYPSLPLAVVLFLLLMIFTFGFNNTANAETLGPNTNLTLKENVTVWIVSPGNTTYVEEPDNYFGFGGPSYVIMNFYVSTNQPTNDIGYSVDGGPIERVVANLTLFETFSNGTTTYFGNNVIFTVPIGPHTVTVFDGYQSDNHYTIYQKDSVSFAVALSTPTPTPTSTIPELPIATSLIVVIASATLFLIINKRKSRQLSIFVKCATI